MQTAPFSSARAAFPNKRSSSGLIRAASIMESGNRSRSLSRKFSARTALPADPARPAIYSPAEVPQSFPPAGGSAGTDVLRRDAEALTVSTGLETASEHSVCPPARVSSHAAQHFPISVTRSRRADSEKLPPDGTVIPVWILQPAGSAPSTARLLTASAIRICMDGSKGPQTGPQLTAAQPAESAP